MGRSARPTSQGWKTFLRNHAAGIASLDLFVVRTISKGAYQAAAAYKSLGEFSQLGRLEMEGPVSSFLLVPRRHGGLTPQPLRGALSFALADLPESVQ